jgi:AcrR family transcriptional regulator
MIPSAAMATQQARRAATRRALLDATIRALVERGVPGTTTTVVCELAGVSQGALFKHFTTKSELLAAAAEDLFAGLIDVFRDSLPDLVGAQDRAEAAVGVLWQVFDSPQLHAAFELYNASRTDRELAARLAPVAEVHGRNLRTLARELFPEAADRPGFDATVSLVVQAIQGASLGSLPAGHRDDHAELVVLLTDTVRKAVA